MLVFDRDQQGNEWLPKNMPKTKHDNNIIDCKSQQMDVLYNSLAIKNVKLLSVHTVEAKLFNYYININYMIFVGWCYVRPTSASQMHVVFAHIQVTAT